MAVSKASFLALMMLRCALHHGNGLDHHASAERSSGRALDRLNHVPLRSRGVWNMTYSTGTTKMPIALAAIIPMKTGVHINSINACGLCPLAQVSEQSVGDDPPARMVCSARTSC